MGIKSVFAVQRVAKDVVDKQQKFYDFCVNNFIYYDARTIIIGSFMGLKPENPIKTDEPLTG